MVLNSMDVTAASHFRIKAESVGADPKQTPRQQLGVSDFVFVFQLSREQLCNMADSDEC
jgi:hypothetical protein